MQAGHPVGPSRQNLFRVWSIRSILVAALLAGLAWTRYCSPAELPWYPLLAVLLAMALVNLLLLLRLDRPWPVGEREFFANLLLDVGFVTAVLYLTGGSTNPLISYYLIPLVISAAVLRPRHTWAIAALTLACYTALFFLYRPLELFVLAGHPAGHGAPGSMTTGAHFLGMWINFAFSALLICWFVVRMAATVRSQQQAINRIREEGLRNEQIIGVASVAAGTAHELRTPLATMNLLAEELAADHPGLAGEMALLREQLARCEKILGELLSASADSSRKTRVRVADLLAALRERWSLARPEVPLEMVLGPAAAELAVEVDPSFGHALMNFLNNAADASPRDVRLEAARAGDALLLRVEDRGPGIPPDIADSLGKRHVSRREGGLGLGVLLSSASVERLGGEVTLAERPGGGTRLEIRLPLAPH
ncbi:MAG: ATP-binding protein [Xanthomonadales bacterium]|jgi:two-component system sensor histidine kinase RegB|nr:ATP-binding protein [Xanthomonadales bacterium]